MNIRKSVIFTICIVLIIISLSGCGKSEAVKNVEALIDGIGEVTLESEEDINKAEEAYNALTDKEKQKVENADLLEQKKADLETRKKEAEEEAEKEAARLLEERRAQLAPFEGKWVPLYKKYLSNFDNDNVFNDFKTIDVNADNLTVTPVDDKTISVTKCGEMQLIDDNGITKLVGEKNGLVYVREEEYAEIVEKMFVHVTLDEDNIGNYIGGPVIIAKFRNEWGDITDSDAYTFKSPAYENEGLIMLGYKNVKFEIFIKGNDDGQTYYSPYPILSGYGNPTLDHFGRAEGEIWYVRSEYVSEITGGLHADSSKYRYFKFTDGYNAKFDVPDTTGLSISVTDYEF